MQLYQKNKSIISFQQDNDPLLVHLTGHIIKQIKKKGEKGNRILDLGCGNGRNAFILADQGFSVMAIDAEKKVIEIAQKKADKLKSKLKFIHGDITKINYNNEFDFVICQEVIEHLKNYQKVVDNAYRALKKNGVFILSTPHDLNQWTILDNYSNHLTRFSTDQIKKMLQRFNNIQIYTIGFPFLRLIFFLYNRLRSKKQQHKVNVKSLIYRYLYIPAVRLFLKIDDLFNNINKGTTIIAVGYK